MKDFRGSVLKPFAAETRFSRRLIAMAALLAFCFLYGAAFALMAPALIVPLTSILIIPAALVIWALPDTNRAPTKLLEALLFALIAVIYLWPNYLAFSISGLPWITFQRLILPVFFAMFLTCLSTSKDFRHRLWAVVMSTPWLTKAILLFVFVQALSIAFSQNPGSSLVAFMLAQMSWTAVFFTAAFVFSFEHNVKRLPLLLCGIPLIQVLIAAIEFRLGHVPWAGHIPSFFKIEDPIVEAILAGGARNGVYRVQTTFSVSLGLSEYMALAFPFSIWWVFHARRIISRIAAVALVPLSIFVVAITQARVGFLGLVITATLYPLILGFSAWWKRKQSILSSAIVFFSPVGIAAAVSAVLIVPALRYRVIGGGQAQLSTQGRIDQINLGIPKILSHPWGYGAGQGAEVLGYHNLAGLLTIDSYWLRAVLEYGILGASIFLLLFVLAVYHSLRGALFVKNETSEATLFVPIGIGLLTFPIMQSAFAAEPNMPAAFLLLGCLSALVFRARQQDHDPQLRAQDRSRLSEINLHKPNWLGGFSS